MKICSKCGLTKPGKMFKNGYICVACDKIGKLDKIKNWIKNLIK